MPRYDYRCTVCRNEFELIQSFSEAGTGTCPVCSGAGQRVFHAVPVIYKGSGFYTTDYGRPKQPADNGSKESSDSKGSKAASEDSASTAKDSKETTSDSSSEATKSKTESSTKSTSENGS